ncbi:MAG: hypothetical protein QOE93_50 [Actinomycetota bacterium]|nr:hypothetical protein [Actinomycetota bacterium]
MAVVPVHNGRDQTLRCLRSLAAGTLPPRVIVVDHGSTDGTAAAVTSEFPDVVVLAGDGNLWWAGATNLGVGHALAMGADAVLTMNNDNVVDREAVKALVACATESAPAVVGSILLDLARPDMIMCAGGTFDWHAGGPVCLGQMEIDRGQYADRHDAEWLPGNSVLVPRACFEAVGLYDARRLPHSWADADLCLRAAAAGWRIMCDGASRVWNDRSTTSAGVAGDASWKETGFLLTSNRSLYRLRPAVRFYLRHCPPRQLPAALARFYHPVLRAVVIHRLSPRTRSAARRVRAVLRR